ncbi:hypothetical protein JD292_01550 [Leucobacter sp. CSA2]|uniref:Uncharacterized protein n=1 Tax=Leucobacter edaphi TaxID=2796472 RepID=A0A934UXC0_9MICO|nr:hypothetical protein [Leucobacter edaphi]MBK0420767.1 hypothetical protein [Leucobacter edaphi]
MQEDPEHDFPLGLRITFYVAGIIGVIPFALLMSLLGRFLSYAAADGRPRPFFNLIMVSAVYGPYMIAFFTILIGGIYLTSRKWASPLPLLGIPTIGILYLICAFSLDA